MASSSWGVDSRRSSRADGERSRGKGREETEMDGRKWQASTPGLAKRSNRGRSLSPLDLAPLSFPVLSFSLLLSLELCFSS